jgi:hypothetical protein
LDELYNRWKCELKSCKNHSNYCYVDSTDFDKHLPLDATDLSRWNKAIEKDNASLDRPSDRLRGYLVRKHTPKNTQSINNNSTSTTQGGSGVHQHFSFGGPFPGMPMPMPGYLTPSGMWPNSPSQQSPNDIRSSSPVYSDPDPHGEMDRFIQFIISNPQRDGELTEELKKKLLEAGEALKADDLNVRDLKRLSYDDLKKMGINKGIAMKIHRYIKRFQREG